MNADTLRKALRELNGERDLTVVFHAAEHIVSAANPCTVKRAMLIPHEEDGLVKVTDGKSVYIFNAESVAWLRIG